MAARIFLGLSALIWLPYGIYCFFQPASLAEAVGVAFTSPTGATELRAMYGGLQAMVGVFALAGALRPAFAASALIFLQLVCFGLATGRSLGAVLDGGGTLTLAGLLVRRMPARA